jgi:hypothetical protein
MIPVAANPDFANLLMISAACFDCDDQLTRNPDDAQEAQESISDVFRLTYDSVIPSQRSLQCLSLVAIPLASKSIM